ncbi:hypothetical protein LSTR_LSTR004269 [Laodelphax striatellus]|uniref:Uncharacterized protein n=1 Tax=Laodelphax striatellus TaxID=195883 RepID=A0A482WHF5_LAOST|nr:hypothetical protein LSTR_LSTR004269 [Laodelphax striatellus]
MPLKKSPLKENLQTEETDKNTDKLHQFGEFAIQNIQPVKIGKSNVNLHELVASEEEFIQKNLQTEETDKNTDNLHDFEEFVTQESIQAENNINLNEFGDVSIREIFQVENKIGNGANLHEFEYLQIKEVKMLTKIMLVYCIQRSDRSRKCASRILY